MSLWLLCVRWARAMVRRRLVLLWLLCNDVQTDRDSSFVYWRGLMEIWEDFSKARKRSMDEHTPTLPSFRHIACSCEVFF